MPRQGVKGPNMNSRGIGPLLVIAFTACLQACTRKPGERIAAGDQKSNFKSQGDRYGREEPDRLVDLENRCRSEAHRDGIDREWLLAGARTARVIMVGMRHGEPSAAGDPRDGLFVANLLPHLKPAGFNYVAVEAPFSLNRHLGRKVFEERAKETFGVHWAEFGPVVQAARKLGMRLVFYDTGTEAVSDSERETRGFARLKEILDKNPRAKIVIYAGGDHIHKFPAERSFIKPERYMRIGGLLHQQLGKQFMTVLLQPENETERVVWHADYKFYLGKGCPNLTSR